MGPTELLWFVPLMLGVSVVVGAAGVDGRAAITRNIVRCFRTLTLGVVAVGVVIHVLARWLA